MADYTPFPLSPWYDRPDAPVPSRAHKVMSAGPDGSGGVQSEMMSVDQIIAQINADDVKPFADPRGARSSKSIDYTATVNDNRKTIAFTASGKTLTLPRATFAAAASDAFELTVSAEAGSVTVSRSGTDTILGATSIVISQGETAAFFLDSSGIGWRAAISPTYGMVARTDAANVFTQRQHLAKGTTIASSAAIALPANGNFFDVSGTAAVAGISTVTPAGTRIQLRATGAFTLQHNAASLILPRSANIALAAGDIVEFVSLGAGNYVLANISKADGTPLAGGSQPFVSTQQSFVAGASLVLAHGLGVQPIEVFLEFVCKSSVAGYAVGDRVLMPSSTAGHDENYTNTGFSVSVDAANIRVHFGTNGVPVVNKGGGVASFVGGSQFDVIVRGRA